MFYLLRITCVLTGDNIESLCIHLHKSRGRYIVNVMYLQASTYKINISFVLTLYRCFVECGTKTWTN